MPKLDLLAEKLNAGREYRNISPGSIQLREAGGSDHIVEGYATTFNEQYLLYDWGDYKVFEQVDARAFDDCDLSDVIFQYNHEGRVMARTRNKTLELAADNHGMKIRADLSGTELGRQLYEEIRGGYTDRMSFGFTVAEDKREIIENRETNVTTVIRTITKIGKLYDVSAVSIPANDATEISARSFADGLIRELEQERLEKRKAENKIKALKLLLEV